MYYRTLGCYKKVTFYYTGNPLFLRFQFPRIHSPWFFRGSAGAKTMGSMEPIKFAKLDFKPRVSIKSNPFRNIQVQNDDLSNSIGSTRSVEPLEPMFQFARISLPANFSFPQNTQEERTSCTALQLQYTFQIIDTGLNF